MCKIDAVYKLSLALILLAGKGASSQSQGRLRRVQDVDAPIYPEVVPASDNDPLFTSLDIPEDAAEAGMWTRLKPWPVVSIHLAVLPDARVVCYGAAVNKRTQDGRVFVFWDPTKGLGPQSISIAPNAENADSFCSSATLMSNGQLLVSGGASKQIDAKSLESSLLDWKSEMSTRTSDLNAPRWYGTMTNLPDGRALMTGGAKPYTVLPWQSPVGKAGRISSTPEVYKEGEGWTLLDGAFSLDAFGAENNRYWYPRQFVTSIGTIFGISTDKMWEMNLDGNGSIKTLGDFKTAPNNETRPNVGPTSTAVMFAPGRIIQVGGNGLNNGFQSPSSAGATVFDITNIGNGEVKVDDTSPMNFPRQWANSAVLHNGEVLVTGGSQFNDEAGKNRVLASEIWNPESGTWTVGASASVYRGYHSSLVVLRNGVVLSSAGGVPGPAVNFNSQLYYPPSLFERQGDMSVLASRPRIVSLSTVSPQYNDIIQVQVAGGGEDVAEVALNALPVVTHSFDSNQRRMTLSFLSTASGVDVNMPADANLAPPGYYYLSVLNGNRVPSVAVIIGLNAAAPTGGGNGVATPFDVAATFYRNRYFQFTPWAVKAGVYDVEQVAASPVGNNIASINVNPGFTVRVCTDPGGEGVCETFVQDKPSLGEALFENISYIEVSAAQ